MPDNPNRLNPPEVLDRVRETLCRERLFDGVSRIWAAVSGGADSMALLYLLHALHTRGDCPAWRALHVAHGLRGAASEADAAFVRACCNRLGVPLQIESVTIPPAGHRQGESLEMAARRARLAVYQRLCAAPGDALATGHQADDGIETLLLRLFRGAGAQGLSALGPRSQVGPLLLIRPLIDCRRAELREWLRQQGHAWREDRSNRDLSIPRNHMRHKVLPQLTELLGADVSPALRRSADLLRADDALLRACAEAGLQRCRCPDAPEWLSVEGLRREPLALRRRMLMDWLWAGGVGAVGFAAVERLLALASESHGTRMMPLRHGWRVQRRYDQLLLLPPSPPRSVKMSRTPPTRCLLNVPGVTEFAGAWRIFCRIVPAPPRYTRGIPFAPETSKGPGGGDPGRSGVNIVSPRSAFVRVCGYEVALDARVWAQRPLRLRGFQPGDRMRPVGLRGSRKLKDIWIDTRVPRDWRATLPVLVLGRTIVWAPGARPAAGWQPRRGRPTLMLRVTPL